MKNNFIHSLILFLSFVAFTETKAQNCTVTIQDSLFPNYDFQLVGIATGVAPFTYNWTITGLATGSIAYQANTAGDTVLINSNDLFSNYGCINVKLCITDDVGCTTCMNDSLYTIPETAPCYAGFSYTEPSPGTIQVNFGTPIPQVIGYNSGTYTDANGISQMIDDNTGWTFTYMPTTVNPNGYTIPFCIQTNYINTPSVICIACDSIHISPVIISSLANIENELSFSVFPIPSSNQLNFQLAKSLEEGHIEILDLTGSVLIRKTFLGDNGSVDLTKLNAGAYLVRILSNKSSATKFFIKS